ncbi:MAG: adenosylhomocysteinase [Archaeoglobaceae archaeon]|nr:adenosylhomocysteinase [Archaeoglobaceae archaeon]
MPYVKFQVSRDKEDKVISFLRSKLHSTEYEKFFADPKGVGFKVYLDSIRSLSKVRKMRKELGLSENDLWDWAFDLTLDSMPVLKRLAEEYKSSRPFKGLTLMVNTHLKENTAVLCYALKEGGADLVVVPVPYSGDEIVYEVLMENGYDIYGEPRMNYEEMQSAIKEAIDENDVNVILEDGLWITRYIVEQDIKLKNIIGSVEQTKAGINLATELRDKLGYPIITVGNAELKESVESGLATPEAIVKMIIQAANWSLAGKRVTIVGYGVVGKGIAKIMRDHGARVRIVEKDLKRVLGAILDGFEVLELESAIVDSDILVTATGRPKVVPVEALKLAKNGILLVNAGSKDYEIDMEGLREIAFAERLTAREGIKKYSIRDGKGNEKVLLVAADGFPINLALGEGTPSDAIDITLSLMAEAARHLVESENYSAGLYGVPEDIQEKIVKYKLESLGYVL